MGIWDQVRKLEGQTLKTLDRKNPFDILRVDETGVIVRPQATGKGRPIARDAIESAAGQLFATGSLTRAEIRESYSEFNPAYVAAILAQLPDVKHKLKPIRLFATPK